MKQFQILIVEDDQSVRNLISLTLKVHQYSFVAADCGKDAIMISTSMNPDLVLLDLGLPDMDGVDVIKSIRSWSNMPIIVISARGNDADKIHALDEGADDYLTKPFSTEELLARIRVVQRRLSYMQNGNVESNLFTNGLLTIDYEAAAVTYNGEELHLTLTEYKLLKLLAQNAGKILTYSMIIREIWGSSVETDIVSLRVHMATLRKKLGQMAQEEPLIRTQVGIGYGMNVTGATGSV